MFIIDRSKQQPGIKEHWNMKKCLKCSKLPKMPKIETLAAREAVSGQLSAQVKKPRRKSNHESTKSGKHEKNKGV